MSDDKFQPGNPDRQRIAMGEDYEVRDWARKFGVTPDALRGAVRAVSNRADDVEAYLKGKGGD